MKIKYSKKGFTLVEMMVVVAIISALATSVVLGFNRFGEEVKMQEINGILQDTIKKLELEIFQKDYDKSSIRFQNDYLIAESHRENEGLTLKIMLPGESSCQTHEVGLEIDPLTNNTLKTAQLRKTDESGNTLEINSFDQKTVKCVDFNAAQEREWNYELLTASQHSQVIRFIHFNLDRKGKNSGIKVMEEGYHLDISAPYGDKKYYKNGQELTTLVLTLQNAEEDQEKLILN